MWRARVSSEVLSPPLADRGVVVVRTIDGKLFGLNAELLFQAEVERTYRIVIDDPSGESGGYTLVVEPGDSASEQP